MTKPSQATTATATATLKVAAVVGFMVGKGCVEKRKKFLFSFSVSLSHSLVMIFTVAVAVAEAATTTAARTKGIRDGAGKGGEKKKNLLVEERRQRGAKEFLGGEAPPIHLPVAERTTRTGTISKFQFKTDVLES